MLRLAYLLVSVPFCDCVFVFSFADVCPAYFPGCWLAADAGFVFEIRVYAFGTAYLADAAIVKYYMCGVFVYMVV